MLQHPHRVAPGRAEIEGLQLLESCSFRWIFDVKTRRFRRTPRDARVWFDADEGWTDYHRLEVDDARSCFVVDLDEARTRILRAWIHSDPCPRCGRDGSATVDLEFRVGWWRERLPVRTSGRASSGGGHPLRPFGGGLRPEGAG